MAANTARPGRVAATAERCIELFTELDETAAAERVKASLERLRLGIFRLVVVGEVKRGKSSFINALLGERDLLPTAVDVATSTVFKVVYGERPRYRVFFAPQDASEGAEAADAPVDICRDELATYGTESLNPDNTKRVDFIAAQLSSPLLKQGLAIIDTPGLGGLFSKHAPITWRYVPSADAVVFVFDSVEAVANRAEMDALVRLAQINPVLFFVQTKTDLVDEAQWRTWQQRNVEIIAQTLGVEADGIIYFPVSNRLKARADERSSTKDLERSGFLSVLGYLNNNLVGTLRRRLIHNLLENMARDAASLRQRLAEQQQIFSQESAEALQSLQDQYEQARSRFEGWKPRARALLSDVRYGLADAKLHALHRLQLELDSAPSGLLVAPVIDRIRSEDRSGEWVVDHAQELNGCFFDVVMQIVADVQAQYEQALRRLSERACEEMGSSLPALIGDERAVSINRPDSKLTRSSSFYEKARNAFFGGSFGFSVAALSLTFVFPPVGMTVAVASAIGGVLAGGIAAMRNHRRRQREQVLNQLASVLGTTVRSVQTAARAELETRALQNERRLIDGFDGAIAETERELQERMAAVADAGRRSRAENQAKAGEFKRRIAQVDAVVKSIDGNRSAQSPDTPTVA